MRSDLKRFLARLVEEAAEMTDDNFVDRVKNLLREFEPVQNPLPGRADVLVRQDVMPCARILIIGYNDFTWFEDVKVREVFMRDDGQDFIQSFSNKQISLADMGIIPYTDGTWNTNVAAFRNDAFTRRSLAVWLEQSKWKAAQESARCLIEKYPSTL